MRRTVERELKLDPGETFTLAAIGEPVTRVFFSAYHDTQDLQLARHGITLRRRAEDGTAVWQLKIPNGASRIELESSDPSESPPAELTDLLAVHLRGRELGRVARLRTSRQSIRRDGAEIVEDAVSVYDGRRVVKRFREVEIELIDGDERSLRKLERVLRKAGAEPGELTPKLFRALDVSFALPPPLAADAAPGEALGRALADQHRQLVDHDPGVRLGDDAESLHQMRVATRRSRAFLRATRGLVEPDWAESLRVELGWLGSILGPARDADVLLAHMTEAVAALADEAAGASLLRALQRERNRARRSALAALSRKRYFVLLDRLAGAERPPLLEDSVRLADLWWSEFKRTRKAFEQLDKASPDDELHAARILVKRTRYAAELASHELGTAGERFVSAAKKLQDVLGEHQDSVVAEDWITRFGDSSPGSDDMVAQLVRQERRRRKQARRAWPEAWERLARRARRARQ